MFKSIFYNEAQRTGSLSNITRTSQWSHLDDIVYDVADKKMNTICREQAVVKWIAVRIWAYKEWGPLHLSVKCFVCRPFGKDQTRPWRSRGFLPVKMRPEQRDVSLLMLGLPINPSYLDLARKSLLLVHSAKVQAPGMLHPQLTMICSPNTPKRLFSPPPIWSSCLFQILFFPLLTLQGLARLLAWLEGVEKKVSKPIGTRAPNLFLESVLFFFENKKATGRNRQYWGERGLFLIWPGLPSVLPRQRHNHSTMGKEGGSDEGGEVFFLQNHGQNYGPSS